MRRRWFRVHIFLRRERNPIGMEVMGLGRLIVRWDRLGSERQTKQSSYSVRMEWNRTRGEWRPGRESGSESSRTTGQTEVRLPRRPSKYSLRDDHRLRGTMTRLCAFSHLVASAPLPARRSFILGRAIVVSLRFLRRTSAIRSGLLRTIDYKSLSFAT